MSMGSTMTLQTCSSETTRFEYLAVQKGSSIDLCVMSCARRAIRFYVVSLFVASATSCTRS